MTGFIRGFSPPVRESMGLTAMGNFLFLFGGQGPEGKVKIQLKSLGGKISLSMIVQMEGFLSQRLCRINLQPPAWSGFFQRSLPSANKPTAK